MATAKTRAELLRQWVRDRLEKVEGAPGARLDKLYAAYRKHILHDRDAYGGQAFGRQLQALGVDVVRRAHGSAQVCPEWLLKPPPLPVGGSSVRQPGRNGPGGFTPARDAPFGEFIARPKDEAEACFAGAMLDVYIEALRLGLPVERNGEGLPADLDGFYVQGTLAKCASALALAGAQPAELLGFLDMEHKRDRPGMAWFVRDLVRNIWPLEWRFWKPEIGARACLVMAGGFILRAIAKIDRDAVREAAEAGGSKLQTGV